MSDKAAELTAQLRGGGSLATSRRRKLVLCGLLALMGCVLAVVGGEEDSVYVGLGALVALTGVVSFVAVVLGWQSARRTWLAREGVVFETASVRYHLPWDSISEVKLVGRSALARVQLSVRDIAEVLQTVRRKQRGGKLKAQARIRRTFELNWWGSKCHVEFMGIAFGVDATALHAVLAGYVADPGRRAELMPLPVSEDMSEGDPTPHGAPGKSGPNGS